MLLELLDPALLETFCSREGTSADCFVGGYFLRRWGLYARNETDIIISYDDGSPMVAAKDTENGGTIYLAMDNISCLVFSPN